ATTPDIKTPEEAREVALAFGSLLRATRKVLRGIGTIREDLNVSIEGGARIEIKGVQELRLIATFVEKEVERQRMLLEVAAELKRRAVRSVPAAVQDVSAVFRETQSKVVASALARGAVVRRSPESRDRTGRACTAVPCPGRPACTRRRTCRRSASRRNASSASASIFPNGPTSR